MLPTISGFQGSFSSIPIYITPPVGDYSYLIDTNGTYTIAKNGTTGEIEFGSTNASAIFNACAGNSTNAELIFVKVGNYSLDAPIILEEGVTLEGEGALYEYDSDIWSGTTLILNGASVAIATANTVDYKRDVHVRNIGINLNGTTNGKGIVFRSVCYGSIEHCNIFGSQTNTVGIALDEGAGSGSFDNNICFNRIANVSLGIDVIGLSDENNICYNLIQDTPTAIEVRNGLNHVTHNMILGCSYGIILDSGQNDISHNTIDTQAGHTGIYVASGHRNIISNNIVGVVGTNGIYLGDADYNLVEGNLIGGVSGLTNGIAESEWDNPDYNVIKDNIIKYATNKYVIYGTHTYVEDHHFNITHNSGTETISASTSVVVTHGLAGSPDIVTVTLGTTGAGNYYVDTFTSTQFTVHVANSGTYTVYWKAIYKP